MEKTYLTKTSEETEKLGEEFTKKLKAQDIVFLIGNLGAGKTTFVKGVARGLGIKSRVISPTFVVLRSHETNIEHIKTLYHLDLYRLENVHDINNIDIDNYANDKSGVVFVEWPEKLAPFIDRKYWKINFDYEEDSRKITIKHE